MEDQPPTYSVTRWDECYENNRTRGMVVMQWIPVPNSHDGDGYIELVSRKNGAAYLGAWLAILQVASKCAERGTLTRRNGKPHTAKSIAKITRLDEKLIAETLQVLASEDVAWLCQAGGTLPAPSAHPTDEEGKKEENRRKRVIDPESMLEIGRWFNRRPSTEWAAKERAALLALGDVSEDLPTLAALYTSGNKYNRKTVQTLLNNWQGEMDRARSNDCKPAVINARNGVVV